MNEDKEILNEVQNQISAFDNKASILLSTIGIIFALSLSFLGFFHTEAFTNQSNSYITWYIVLFIVFCFLTLETIFCFVMVIYPRVHKNNTKYPNYYKDIAEMDDEEFSIRKRDYFCNEDMRDEQILINSRICSNKHKWLVWGLISVIPFALLLVTLTIFVVLA